MAAAKTVKKSKVKVIKAKAIRKIHPIKITPKLIQKHPNYLQENLKKKMAAQKMALLKKKALSAKKILSSSIPKKTVIAESPVVSVVPESTTNQSGIFE